MKWKQILIKGLPYVMSLSLMSYIVSCGSDSDGDGDGTNNLPQQEEQQNEGVYSVTLTSLNTSVTDAPAPIAATGNGVITITTDEFNAVVNMNGVSQGIHLQNIFTGVCPTSANAGDDGIVDVVEASVVAGKILIPLDSDLSSQEAGFGTGGIGGVNESYVYTETVGFAQMLDDLRLPDPNDNDLLVKLPQGEGLNLHGKVLIIHGVDESISLPETVQTVDGITKNASLPIACGEITRSIPGGTTGGPN